MLYMHGGPVAYGIFEDEEPGGVEDGLGFILNVHDKLA